MSKKVQIIIWAIIAALVCILIGGYVYNTVLRYTEGNTHPEVTFELQDYGTVKMELYPEYAPNTVANFVRLVEKGFYNNKVVYGKDDICLYARSAPMLPAVAVVEYPLLAPFGKVA